MLEARRPEGAQAVRNVAKGFVISAACGCAWLTAIWAWRMDHGVTLAGGGFILLVVAGEAMEAQR